MKSVRIKCIGSEWSGYLSILRCKANNRPVVVTHFTHQVSRTEPLWMASIKTLRNSFLETDDVIKHVICLPSEIHEYERNLRVSHNLYVELFRSVFKTGCYQKVILGTCFRNFWICFIKKIALSRYQKQVKFCINPEKSVWFTYSHFKTDHK